MTLYEFDGKPYLFDGAALRRVRYRHGMVQLHLAHALGVYPSNISTWERGTSWPRHHQAVKLRSLLGKDAWEVFKVLRYVRDSMEDPKEGEASLH
jgi:transcriptional regulator with XRE-family HTH domain